MSDDLRGALIRHLLTRAVRTDGPFTLRSGEVSSWYVDARQTTFDGAGATLVGEVVLSALAPDVEAVGGLTLGADPIAVATAIAAARRDRPLRAFSVRKEAKGHGTGGRLVGPVGAGDRAVVVEDTTTTGGAMADAVEAARAEGLVVVAALALVDRSGGTAARRMEELGLTYRALVTPTDLGVE